jgi:Putative polyhydroxyalkanoic acid system protein (PHA_gran_rgn)
MELTIEVPTAKAGMTEIRPLLDAAFQKEFPGGMLQRKWNGDVLELSGPGARGTIAYETGRLVGRATLGPPASLMRPLIESKVTAALKAVA